LGAVVASGVPDLDVLGVLLGFELGRVHRRATHSLLVLSALAGLALWASHGALVPWDSATVWVWTIALLAHPLVDTLTTTGTAHFHVGIPLFWPLLSRRYHLPLLLVRSPSLFNYARGSLWRKLLLEIVLLGPTCLTLVLLGSVL
jgi:membrane-bound metal-dependent hydrolase YbcI (DUF457 family)